MSAATTPPFQKSFVKMGSIPRSRSDFCYVSLTPQEKRRTTDFSHLLPQFNKDPPYARLKDPKQPVVHQPTTAISTTKSPFPKMCRSATGAHVAYVHSPVLDVARSQSMRSLRKSIDSSPTKLKSEEGQSSRDRKTSSPTVSQSPSLAICRAIPPEELKDFQRLRNFSTTSKGLVNWGDSFRSQSMPFVTIERASSSDMTHMPTSASGFIAASDGFASGRLRKPANKLRIVLLGSSNVGKTTMVKQFRTSEYICAFDSSNDESNHSAITVILNGEEFELEFVDTFSQDDETDDEGCETGIRSKPFIPTADGYVVVYSVTSRRSFLHGLSLLSRVQNAFISCPVILVGNKSDLVRIRAVTTDEGTTSAKEHNCPFMETSVAINHQIDELLVAILTEMRNRDQTLNEATPTKISYPQCSLCRAKGLIKKFLKKACFQSKSCDNLQRL